MVDGAEWMGAGVGGDHGHRYWRAEGGRRNNIIFACKMALFPVNIYDYMTDIKLHGIRIFGCHASSRMGWGEEKSDSSGGQ